MQATETTKPTPGQEDRAKPLANLRVIEIGHSIAAPYAGMILGELGADVIKVENPHTGDYARGWGPPFSPDGTASVFEAVNRGKRGITVDLADLQARAGLRTMIEQDCDVLIHNLKFGAMERLGLSPESLMAANPKLIYCNLGAFGATGPLRELPGYDPLMQAFGGLMSVLGEDGRPPMRVGVSIIDLSTGMWSVIGILALLQQRTHTGQGGRVDTSLYESALAWMSVPIAAYDCSGEVPRKAGSGTPMIVPYQAFATADGHIMVAAGNDNLFRRLARVLGHPELAIDPRFQTNAGRVMNRETIIPILQQVFSARPTNEWSGMLAAGGVPSGPIQTVDQVVTYPQTHALGIVQAGPGGNRSLVGLPISLNGRRPAFEQLPPRLGEHNEDIIPRHRQAGE